MQRRLIRQKHPVQHTHRRAVPFPGSLSSSSVKIELTPCTLHRTFQGGVSDDRPAGPDPGSSPVCAFRLVDRPRAFESRGRFCGQSEPSVTKMIRRLEKRTPFLLTDALPSILQPGQGILHPLGTRTGSHFVKTFVTRTRGLSSLLAASRCEGLPGGLTKLLPSVSIDHLPVRHLWGHPFLSVMCPVSSIRSSRRLPGVCLPPVCLPIVHGHHTDTERPLPHICRRPPHTRSEPRQEAVTVGPDAITYPTPSDVHRDTGSSQLRTLEAQTRASA